MKNIVITGMVIRSCIGNTYSEVLKNLQAGKSGITKNETYSKMGFRSQVAGSISIELSDFIDRKLLRFMGEGSAYSYLAALDALEMAGLDEEDISSPKVGIVAGSGGASTRVMVQTADIAREKGPKRIGPYAVTKSMGSSISAILGTALKLKGINYSISSACATSAHCIGHAAELIKSGQQDIVLAGGGEDEHWSSSSLFDAMGALSSNFNNSPTSASRPYDKKRDGFVISGGAGIVVLESEEFAKKRGANILAKLEGYFATSDGYDMVAPSGEGAKRCMEGALKNLDSDIDYINTHGTSTPVGDIAELNAIKDIFKQKIPSISSTKSMTGHSLGATGVHETIFSIMMLREGFIAPSINIHDLCDEAKDINVITEAVDQKLNSIMSLSLIHI